MYTVLHTLMIQQNDNVKTSFTVNMCRNHEILFPRVTELLPMARVIHLTILQRPVTMTTGPTTVQHRL
jgi:hypothetical protein